MSNKKFIVRIAFWFSFFSLIISVLALYKMSTNEIKFELMSQQHKFNSDLLTVISKRSVSPK